MSENIKLFAFFKFFNTDGVIDWNPSLCETNISLSYQV